MKTMVWAAALAVSAATPLWAQQGPGAGGPPPGVMGQINLGKAGLLGSFYSNDAFGTAQYRIGQDRSTIGAATAPGGATTGYTDGASNLIVPLNALKLLPDGKSYLRFGLELNRADGAQRMIELNGDIARLDVQYLTFPNPDTMYGIGVFYNKSSLDIVGSGTIDNKGFGVRADVVRKLNSNWGVAARAEYAWGESDLKLAAGPGVTLRHVQGDDRFYMQAELVGTYTKEQMGVLPDGWVFHPTFGFNYQHNRIEATADSFGAVSSGVIGDTENYGTIWAVAQLEKAVPPGSWSPSFRVGLEHEYVNDLNRFVDEPTYAILGAGLSYQSQRGHRIDIAYSRHQGLNGKRWNQALVAAFTMSF